MTNERRSRGIAPHLLAAGLVLSVVALAWALDRFSPERYYRWLQEDEALEWITFWAFAGASILAFLLAARQRRGGTRLPWFLLGVGVFCFFVAGEEISWGQRLLGFRPPAYFLETNFQQELNFHNVVETSLRKLVLKAVIIGYGIVLPLLALFRPLRRLLRWAGVQAPSPALLPAFGVAFAIYQVYPWRFSGELVELMLGLGLFYALLLETWRPAAEKGGGLARRPFLVVAVSAVVLVLLGAAVAEITRRGLRHRPELIEAAKLESEALARDFRSRAKTRCGRHKRLFTFVKDYDQTGLFDGEFAALTERGLPEERAAFFLDPWNSPYWIRHRCIRSAGVARAFVYSFGPNRRRDSSVWEIAGDDIGTMIVATGSLPSADSD